MGAGQRLRAKDGRKKAASRGGFFMAAKNYFFAAGAAAAAAAAAAASAGAEAAAAGADASAAGAGAGAATGAGAGAGASSFLPQAARATAATIAAKTSDLFIFRFLDEYKKTIFREWPTKSSRSIVQAGELELFQPNLEVYPYKPTDVQPSLSKIKQIGAKTQAKCANCAPSSGLFGSALHQPARVQPVSQ